HGSNIQIGITSSILTSDGLDGVPGYLYRVRSTTLYERTTSTIFPAQTPVFRKITDNTEITCFLVHDNRYAVIAIAGGVGDDDNLSDIFETVAKNWQWS
ncbi:MAG TPA: hypothetical protein VIJ25_06795, partial [Methylococcales bacterium]